jgi:GNAT superfamily N-acetyltransferase
MSTTSPGGGRRTASNAAAVAFTAERANPEATVPDSRADVSIRPATDDDYPGVLELARVALGWTGGDDEARTFAWKHLENPFGTSPMWVAVVDDRVVGFRTFMRWEFVRGAGRIVLAARAVDTATAPDYEGRGIFTRLTLAALPELAAAGVELVFNTPNQRSLPGYLKMGWHVVGRLSVAVTPTRPGSLVVMATARRPASRRSIEMHVGEPAVDVFADAAAIERLQSSWSTVPGLATRRTPAFLRWRYGNEALQYRVALAGSSLDEGLAVFRLRRRGPALEGVVCDVLTPGFDPSLAYELVRRVARLTQADYLIRLDRRLVSRHRAVRLPRAGPVLTCRPLAGEPAPALHEWRLTMGDIELF